MISTDHSEALQVRETPRVEGFEVGEGGGNITQENGGTNRESKTVSKGGTYGSKGSRWSR